jgi:hypothetical protein
MILPLIDILIGLRFLNFLDAKHLAISESLITWGEITGYKYHGNYCEGVLAIIKKDREKTADTNRGSRPLHCPKCGEKASSEMKFCSKCGTSLRVTVQPSAVKAVEAVPRAPDILGLASAGVLLIIIALTYVQNPFDFAVITGYFESMGSQGTYIKPPLVLFDAAIFFFYAVGVWGIVLSGLRAVLQRNVKKALGDIVGGLLALFVAFLLTNYATDVFTGRATLAYFIMAIGLLVIANTIIHYGFPERRQK